MFQSQEPQEPNQFVVPLKTTKNYRVHIFEKLINRTFKFHRNNDFLVGFLLTKNLHTFYNFEYLNYYNYNYLIHKKIVSYHYKFNIKP